jgi:hypothetical protein
MYTTGQQRIDDTLRGMIGIFEAAFPGRIWSYYLVGSYVDGSATPLSDVDVRIIFKGDFAAGEEERMRQVRECCRLISPIAIDCPPLCEARLLHDEDWLHEPLGIKADGQLLYGEAIGDSFPEPAFSAYVRNVTAVPVSRFGRIRGQSRLRFPLAYPDPAGEFYGYVRRIGPPWARVPSTKDLVHMVGFAATCLIALEAERMVTRKRDWLELYKETIGDGWTPLLEAVYVRCKEAWSYRLPEDEGERGRLRDICGQIVAFENYYLTCYRTFLLTELQSGDSARQRFAVARLNEVVYPDEEIQAALRGIERDG